MSGNRHSQLPLIFSAEGIFEDYFTFISSTFKDILTLFVTALPTIHSKGTINSKINVSPEGFYLPISSYTPF